MTDLMVLTLLAWGLEYLSLVEFSYKSAEIPGCLKAIALKR